jgi:murein DD-endopeptidase MepM/ murein hydrolase activator NlpD
LNTNRSRKRNIPLINFQEEGINSGMVLSVIAIAIAATLTSCNKIQSDTLPAFSPSSLTKVVGAPTQTFTPEITYTFTASISPTTTLVETPTSTLNPNQYVFPVRPERSVDYAEGLAAHGYPAIDIFAPVGWEYVAVTGGIVEFISYADIWDPVTDDPGARGGIAIAIIGEDGLRYYGSHLLKIADGIEAGQRVTAGQLLGYIGESGNAHGTAPHLHFGISHPTYPEDWKTRRGEIDPFPYLNAWAAGINITPRYSTPTPGQ